MTEQQKPAIEFPCEDYPVKVMGPHEDDFAAHVLEIVHRHAPGFDQEKVSYRESRTGRYLSVTIMITATGPQQLSALFEDLKAGGRVSMVL